MRENIVVVYKTDGRKGLRLTIAEIETLLFLFEQTFLTQHQLYQFYSTYFATTKPPLYDTFKKRTKKFEQLGLIDVHKYHMKERKNGVRLNILQLTEIGYKLLVHSGFLKNEPYIPPIVTRKWDRILAAKEVILDVMQFELNEHGVLQSYVTNGLFLANPKKSKLLGKIKDTHINYPIKPIVIHSEHLLYYDKMFHVKHNFRLLPTNDVALSIKRQGADGPTIEHIEPDWLFQINNQFLIVEIDLGYRKQNKTSYTEQISIIEALETLIDNIPKGIQIKIVYVHVDNSFPFRRIYPDHTKRISIMNSQLDSILIANPSLSIYTCTLKRKQNIIQNVLENIWDYQDNDFIDDILTEFEQGIEPHAVIQRNVHLLTKKGGIQNLPLIEYFSDLEYCILVKEKEMLIERQQYYIPLIIREGELTAQYKLFVYSNYLKTYKKQLNYTDSIKILAVYPNEDELTHDFHRLDLALDEIIFCSLDNIPISAIVNTH